MNLPTPTLGLAGWMLLAGLILGSIAGWRVTAWVNQGHELKAVRMALRDAQASYNAQISDLKRQIQHGYEASSSYQAEITQLRARPVPTRIVRLCESTPKVPSATGADTAHAGSDAASPAAGLVPPTPGRNIGPDLYALIGRADELSAQCRGLQHFLAH